VNASFTPSAADQTDELQAGRIRKFVSRLLTMRVVLAIAFTMIAIVPTVFLSGWVERTVLQHEVEAVEEKHLLLATNSKQSLERYVDDVETGFDLFVQALQFDQTSHYLQQLALRLKFRSLEIYAPDGLPEYVWNVAGKERVEIARDIRNNLVAGAPADALRFYPVQLDTRGRPTIYLARELPNGDVAIGVLSTDFIRKLQHSIAFGDGGHAAIVDRTGQVLAHPKAAWVNTLKDISAIDPVARMLRGETGVTQFYSPAVKADMIAGFTFLPETGWGVMVPQPFSELQARVDRFTNAAYAVIALGFVVAAILGWFLAGFMLRPVNAVIQGTSQIADGHLDWRVPTDTLIAPRELRALGQNFNDMVDEVQASHAALKVHAEEERRDLLGRIAEHLPGIIFRRVAEPGGVTYPVFNVGTPRVFGFERHMVTTDPTTFIDAIIPEDRELWQRLVEGEIEAPESRYQDVRVRMPSGQIAWARLFGTVRRQGERIVWDGGAIDVTQEKTTEQQLMQSQKMQAMGKLTGGIAHDFNNLLAIILGHLELVEEQLDDGSRLRPFARNAIDAAEKGADLTSRLLAFTRNQELRPQATDLDILLSDMQPLLDSSIGETVEIDYQSDGASNIVKIDQNQLENALLNLVINARDAMPDGGKIKVRTECLDIGGPRSNHALELPPGRYVRLSVTDSGTGIEPKDLTRVFEPFFTTKRTNEGSGLGLSMVHGFVRQSDGDIEIISEPNAGTTVNIYVPQATDLIVDRPSPPISSDIPVYGAGKSILLIEDETVVGDICENFLSQLGYGVVRADTGENAIQILHDRNFEFDGIVSDVVLPGPLTGPNVVELAIQQNPAIGILMMSGYPEDHCKKLLAHCQHAIYLRKPFRKQVFGEHLAMALNATRFKQPKKTDAAQEPTAITAAKA
jgi:PAS domain S-box-containing protein